VGERHRGPGSAPQGHNGPDDVAHLLTRAADGDQQAWNRLVERFSPLLWSVCRSIGLGNADSADAFQLTWMRLLENLDSIHDPARLAGWLGTTCRRECLSIIRRGKRTQPTGDDLLLDRFAEPGDGADRPVLVAERDAALWRAFGRLDQRCRDILRILVVEPDGGRASYELAAAALGMPVGSLGPNRGRCLARLRKWLDAEGISRPPADS
jgi:RNA polymerase sigma factor (sigma-70 family)